MTDTERWFAETVDRIRTVISNRTTKELHDYLWRRAGTVPEVVKAAFYLEIAYRQRNEIEG